MTIPIAAVGVLLLAMGVYGAWRVHRLHQRGTDILAENVSSIRSAEGVDVVVREMRYRLKRYLSTENPRHLTAYAELLPEGIRWLSEAEQRANTDHEVALLGRIRNGFRRAESELPSIAEEIDSPQAAQRIAALADEVLPSEILAPARQYIHLNEQEALRSNRRNEETANRLMLGLLLLGTCGGVAGLLAGYGIARYVSRTIVQLSFPIRDVAGKLNEVVGPVAVSAEPEFRDLENVLTRVSQRVTTIVDRLQRSEQETLRAEQLAAVGQLAAGLAHELRNPLTSMKVIVQSAAEPGDLDAKDLAILKEETARLEKSVQTFLDFARPPQPEKRCVDLSALVAQTVDLASPRAARRRITLDFQPAPDSAAAEVDPVQFRQVVLNLVLNALDAAENGGRVRVEVFREAEAWAAEAPEGPDEAVAVRVSDDGPGLPASLGARIFDPFISTKETGLGLGLSICSRIVDAHGGRIEAADGAAGGAVFTVRFPSAPRTVACLPC